jgi:hypothetical protein
MSGAASIANGNANVALTNVKRIDHRAAPCGLYR